MGTFATIAVWLLATASTVSLAVIALCAIEFVDGFDASLAKMKRINPPWRLRGGGQ